MGEPTVVDVGIRDVVCGSGVTIIAPCNIYECVLGDGVFVGPFCEIQRGVRIGDRSRIQSHSFVCEQVTIGSDCFVAHGVMFINDLFRGGGPARGDRSQWSESNIGDGVSIGSNATILPVSIAANSVIGAGAVVTRDVTEKGVYVGNPARRVA